MGSDVNGSVVVVLRCSDVPVPLIPAVTVTCSACGTDCWLSARTGAGTIAAAAAFGRARICCIQCVREMAARGVTVFLAATRAAVNEARGAVN